MRLLPFGDDGSFLELTGFSREAFSHLKIVIYGDDPVRRLGRRSNLDPFGELGLYLFYVGSQLRIKHLCLIFGVVPTTAIVATNKVMKRICRILRTHPASRVVFLDENQMRTFADMVQLREPMVNNVIGFVDGLSLAVQCSDSVLRQNAAYNGYSHDTCCTNVFAFSPLGKIMYCAYNYPGSWHDSTVAQDLANLVI